MPAQDAGIGGGMSPLDGGEVNSENPVSPLDLWEQGSVHGVVVNNQRKDTNPHG